MLLPGWQHMLFENLLVPFSIHNDMRFVDCIVDPLLAFGD